MNTDDAIIPAAVNDKTTRMVMSYSSPISHLVTKGHRKM